MGYHMAVIPDGNRRYARNHDLPKRKGHENGFENAKTIVEDIDDSEYDINEVTLWGLSYDNAEKRSKSEVKYLNEIFRQLAKYLKREMPKRNADFRLVGCMDKIEDRTEKALRKVEKKTEGNEGIKVNLALGYGGRWDIAQAVRSLMEDDRVPDRENIEEELCFPEIDIVIGYGDDRDHLSHLANWQVGYSTLYFPKKNFPDAESKEIDEAIEKHKERKKSRGA